MYIIYSVIVVNVFMIKILEYLITHLGEYGIQKKKNAQEKIF